MNRPRTSGVSPLARPLGLLIVAGLSLTVSAQSGALVAPPRPAPGPPSAPAAAPGGHFLLADTLRPRVTISWPTTAGGRAEHTAELAYRDPEGRVPIGGNLEAFVTLGGSRSDFGAADPAGAVVRVGFYKKDKSRPFFDALAPDGRITVTLTGVTFVRPAIADAASIIHHVKFEEASSVLGCVSPALSPDQVNTYNTADAALDLNGKLTPKNSRRGVLTSPGGVSTNTAADGSVGLEAHLPYALFKHVDDPWLRATPGSFVEPFHFHVEMQVLPADRLMPDRQGASPPPPPVHVGSPPRAKSGPPAPSRP